VFSTDDGVAISRLPFEYAVLLKRTDT